MCPVTTKAAFFDLDGTLTKAHVWGGILDYFKVHNLRRWTHRGYMAYHYPFYFASKLGLISDGRFREPWSAHLGWYVRGYSIEGAEQVWNWVVDNQVNKNWREDTCQILHKHKEEGDLTILVSGTPMPLLQIIVEDIGADHAVGTDLEIRDGMFTGRSSGPACIGDNKVFLTRAYLERNGIAIDYDASYAYADSISDQHMLEMVAHPVATYPDEALGQLAQDRGWQIYPENN